MEKLRIQLSSRNQMSDSELVMAFLTLSGGLQDAYTYWMRDGVFANAQTGNIVLMSGYLFHGEWAKVIRYLIPIVAFCLGVIVADQIRGFYQKNEKIHWRQVILILEMLGLGLAGMLPASMNPLANALISCTCAMQVESFRKVNGHGYASTMCIGNLRGAMSAFSQWMRTKEMKSLWTCCQYLKIIFCFAVGAIIGTTASAMIGLPAIWISDLFLGLAFLLLFYNPVL
ncbi:MAG: YoaK family protein [Eubacteriales bacterium]|nr:YoaK family protein [Eubacteriales bacterium]